MAEAEQGPGLAQWQVTCPCGWRIHGVIDAVVLAVQAHAREAHGHEPSREQVMETAVRLAQG